jgi:hypothetical protein
MVGFFQVRRHLPGRYYSESNGAAIRLGRVDLPRAVADDTEVVPPKSKKQIHR